jgi:pilus assembly protein CpaF
MATAHANTPTDSLRRIESLCLQSGIELPMVAVRAQVASAINFIVCCERLQDGSRKTIAISEVQPLNEKGDYRTQDLWLFVPVTKDEDGKILGYHAPTGVLPSFLAKARAYGFEDLTDEFFDPRTYGLPVPPAIHGVGEGVITNWAPSLKHRERHEPDPDSMKEEAKEFEEKLKRDAKAAKAGNAPQVQVPAGPKPGAAPARPSAVALPRAGATPANRDDATPPPTRNPLLAKKPAPQPEPHQEESSVEVSESLVDDDGNSTAIKPNPLNDGARRPGPAPVRPPVKPPPPRR